MTEQEFITKLHEHNIDLTPKMIDDFRCYFELISEYNKVMDLTSVDSKEEVYDRHFYNSLKIAFNKDFNDVIFADVGAGAGFPSIPLKIVFPNMKLTIIDPLKKRMRFLEMVIEKLNLSDVTLEVNRVEDVSIKYKERFDIVAARAVARLNILTELVCQIVKVNGTFIAMKGINGDIELDEATNALEVCNFVLDKREPSEESINFYFTKIKHTNSKYPRIYSKIKGAPL